MNIVFVSKECPPSRFSSGIGTYVWEAAHHLSEQGHNITIIAALEDALPADHKISQTLQVIRVSGYEHALYDRNVLRRSLWARGASASKYRRLIADILADMDKSGQVDVVESAGYRGECCYWAHAKRNSALVTRMHGFTSGVDLRWRDHLSATRRLQRKFEHLEMRNTDYITAVSDLMKSKTERLSLKAPITTLHNGIDFNFWKAADSHKSGVSNKDIVFAGTLSDTKGIFHLIRSLQSLRRDHWWNGSLYIAGARTEQFERFLKAHSHALQLSQWLHLLGKLPRTDLAALYRSAGACCFPSLKDPFPYTCLEAMAAGGLVIGTYQTGMQEMLNQQSGYLVEPGDCKQLAQALRQALSTTPTEREHKVKLAQHTVKVKFDKHVIGKAQIAFYTQLLTGGA